MSKTMPDPLRCRLAVLTEAASKLFMLGDFDGARTLTDMVQIELAAEAQRPAPVVPLAAVPSCPREAHPVSECALATPREKETKPDTRIFHAPAEPPPADGPGAPLIVGVDPARPGTEYTAPGAFTPEQLRLSKLERFEKLSGDTVTPPPPAEEQLKSFEPAGVLPPSRRRILRAAVELAGGTLRIPRETFEKLDDADVFYSIAADGKTIVITSRETRQRGEGVGL